MRTVRLDEFMPRRLPSVNPAKFTEETFELWSVPSFDAGQPEILQGSEIGSSKKVVEKGDLLLSRIVPHIRRAWIVDPTTNNRQIGSGEWITFRSDDFHAPYLRHILVSDRFNLQLMQTIAGVGGSLLRARPESVREIEIPLPPLSEQKRIAAILDQADALRRQRQRALDHLNQLGQSIFYDMFGDPISNQKAFPLKKITDIARKERHSIKRGPFGGALKKEIFVDSGYLVYEQYHALNRDFDFERYYITQKKYDELKAFEVFPNDILVSCSGVYLGKLAIVPAKAKKGIINQALLKLSLDQNIMLNEVFVQIFRNLNFRRAFFGEHRGSGVPNFPPMTRFKEFDFICPPMSLQKSYLEKLTKVENLIFMQSSGLKKAEEIFASLQQRAFRGDL